MLAQKAVNTPNKEVGVFLRSCLLLAFGVSFVFLVRSVGDNQLADVL
ncbi:hypothetical protein [Helicobacter sp.]|nr:hypothetical protein [Helicobacter sp.]MBR2495088.1 hypothetical protein [Helicobacter sp.]